MRSSISICHGWEDHVEFPEDKKQHGLSKIVYLAGAKSSSHSSTPPFGPGLDQPKPGGGLTSAVLDSSPVVDSAPPSFGTIRGKVQMVGRLAQCLTADFAPVWFDR